MKRDLPWLSRLDTDRKGLWAVVWPEGYSFNVDQLVWDKPKHVIARILSCSAGECGPNQQDGLRTDLPGQLERITQQATMEAMRDEPASVRIILADFHKASCRDRCALARRARSLQEMSARVSIQHVFCGQWSYQEFRKAYREEYGHGSSPPAHRKDVLQVPAVSGGEVVELLAERRIIGRHPTVVERLACDYIVEQTSGEEFLINEMVAHIEAESRNWTGRIQRIARDVAEVDHVVNDVGARLDSLSAEERRELLKLLSVHVLIRDMESLTAEKLWLAGLVRIADMPDGKKKLKLVSPLVEMIVRRRLRAAGRSDIALSEEQSFENTVAASAAYERVAGIERLLRNLIVTLWRRQLGDAWSSTLEKIRTSVPDDPKDEGTVHVVKTIDESQLPSASIDTGVMHDSQAHGPTVGAKRRQISILESATGWQKRQQDHHGVELVGDCLIEFLTTHNLIKVLVDKKCGFCKQDMPFRRESLGAALDEYVVIRAAVAHNQALTLSAVERLGNLEDTLAKWLTVYADGSEWE